MRRWKLFGLVALLGSMPLLMAQSGGFPSRPTFQQVIVRGPSGSLGQVRIRGASAGVSNVAYLAFEDSAGTQTGYIGDGGSANNDISLGAYVAGANIDFAPGTGGLVRANGSQVCTANGTGCPAVGSVATFSLTGTGFASSPVWNCRYAIAGRVATVNCDDRFNTTSNATTFGMTGWPAAINPAQTCFSPMIFGANNSAAVTARLYVDTGGGVTVQHTLSASGLPTAWTASGTKGLAGFSISCVIP